MYGLISPGDSCTAPQRTSIAIQVIFFLHVVKEFLNFDFLLAVVGIQDMQGRYPSLLDKLVVTSELPSDHLFGIFGGEIELL